MRIILLFVIAIIVSTLTIQNSYAQAKPTIVSAVKKSYNGSDVSCTNANNGEITVIASGGSGTYQYSSDNGSTYQSGNVLQNLKGGQNAVVVVRDAKDLNKKSAAMWIWISNVEPLIINTFQRDSYYNDGGDGVSCAGKSDGKIVIQAHGGTVPYKYSIDGGKTFKFVGWVVPPYNEKEDDLSLRVKLEEDDIHNPHPNQSRAVMSQTIRLKNGKLISAMRRKYKEHNWVDAYVSEDKGKSWTFLSEVGNAGAGNGNPPALNITDEGRLVAVFGNRKEPGTMMVVYSDNEGGTWSEPKILRDGYGSADMETIDLGYPLLLKRNDGKMIAFYYWSTKDCLHHIAATIWDADN